MVICKIYGSADLLAAVIIFFSWYGIPDLLRTAILIIMLIKGVPSLAGDFMCRIYGVIDIAVGLVIWFSFLMPDFIRIFLAVVLVFKGIPSMFAH